MPSSKIARTRRTAVLIGFSVYVLLASAWLARSDSLFPIKAAKTQLQGSNSSASATLFSDVRARNVDDLLLVTIAESTTAQSSAQTKTKQSDSIDVFGGTGLWSRLLKDLSLTAGNSRSGSGEGSTTRSGTLITTLSVTVKEVLSNGVLLIEGSRLITINQETQRVTLIGKVRPEDIAGDNTIPSNLIADVQVRYDGKGTVGSHQRQGILTRIFQFLF